MDPVNLYLVEVAHRHAGVAVALGTDVRGCQGVALPINLFAEAQSTHLDRSRHDNYWHMS